MVDAFLRFFEISVRCVWPLVFVFVLYLFRRQLASLLPELSKRLTKAEVASTKWEFGGALRDAVAKEQQETPSIPEFGVQEAIVNSLSVPLCSFLLNVANRPLHIDDIGSAYKATFRLSPDESSFWIATGILAALDGILVRVDAGSPKVEENRIFIEIHPEVLHLITRKAHPELAVD
jgi:hypothetical protein